MRRPGLLEIAAFMALATLTNPATATAQEPLAGRWQYLQPPDPEGEILDLSLSSEGWRGTMNGLERAGEHGLFYYVTELEEIVVSSDGTVRFEVGERALHRRRPAAGARSGEGDAGVVRDRMRFTGRIEGADLVLRCAGPTGSCPDSTMRFRRLPGALAGRDRSGRDTTGFLVAIQFSVTDTTAIFEHSLGSDLLIRVRREPPAGWVVFVGSVRGEEDQPNLLYHSLSWRGPYPTDVFAWSRQSRLFPDERVLPVRGHPYEVRIRLLDCRTSGTGDEAIFEGGRIEVSWRLAPASRGSLE